VADQGVATGQARLGLCYSYGLGVAKDPILAASWWRKAAEQGFASAQDMLAGAYQRGEGVPKDLVEACTLRLLAGPRDAKKSQALADLQASLTPAELALAQERVQHYRKIIARNEAERGRPKHLR
jgi:TPR repeat protein